MGSGLTDRRQHVEQQLFEVEIRLERARNALEVAELQLDDLRAHVREATERLESSQTARADQEWCAARARVVKMSASADGARRMVEDLEAQRDGLLSKLVG